MFKGPWFLMANHFANKCLLLKNELDIFQLFSILYFNFFLNRAIARNVIGNGCPQISIMPKDTHYKESKVSI